MDLSAQNRCLCLTICGTGGSCILLQCLTVVYTHIQDTAHSVSTDIRGIAQRKAATVQCADVINILLPAIAARPHTKRVAPAFGTRAAACIACALQCVFIAGIIY